MEEKSKKNPREIPAAETENPMSAKNPAEKGMEVIKKQAQYPTYAVIMCAGAAVGHLLGTYVFADLMTCTAVGMGAGILVAFAYSRKKKRDEER